jgi:Tol biopolymer transport system component/DNA-binding winged helix-turn-helix (wHTH) protein
MNSPDKFPPPFRLGDWVVRPDLNRIEPAGGEGGPVQVEPRVMKVLLCLAEEPGRVWTRLDLLDAVWGEAVVGEEILTRAVSELRRVFGDSARQPAYIETIRNHGYRLIARVEVLPGGPGEREPAAPDAVPPEEGPSQPDPAPAAVETEVPVSRSRNWPMALLIVVILGAMALLGPEIWTGRFGRDTSQEAGTDGSRGDFSARAAVPLTSYPGREWHPALAPDGTRVAFVRRVPGAAGSDIFLKQRNSEQVLQLTEGARWTAWPTWSPDGQSIAFVQGEESGAAICSVPSLGGAVRRLHLVGSYVDGLDWSPDGGRLVFAARDSGSGEYRLFLLDLTELAVTMLPAAREQAAGAFQPRFSPDGGHLAWLSVDQAGVGHLVVRPEPAAPGGGGRADPVQARRISPPLAGVQGLAWSADGRSLVYAASLGGAFNLWQVPLDDPQETVPSPRWIATAGDFAWNPSIARHTGDLVYEQVRVDQDLWRVRVLSRDPWELETAPFLPSTRWEFEGRYSPDGQRLAFVSARSGFPEVWLADPGGGQLQQLTNLQGPGIANLRWSPGGRKLAFNAFQQGRSVILRAELNGAPPRRLTPDGQQEICSGWSHDGLAILFARETGGRWELYRRPLAGGRERAITREGGISGQESADGRLLYFTRPGRAGLWRLQLDGGIAAAAAVPELVIAELAGQDRHNWTLSGGRIYWVLRSAGSAILAEYDPATGRSSFLTEMPRFAGNGLGASPAGDAIIFARTGDMAGDLMLVPAPQVP